VTARSSRPCWKPSGFLVSDWGGPGFVRCGCEATKRIHHGRTVPICGAAGSAARSQNLPTRQATANDGERPVGVLGLRPRGLQGPARGRVRHQPAQAEPGRGHAVRQARGPLQSDRPHRRDQRVAVTCRTSRSHMSFCRDQVRGSTGDRGDGRCVRRRPVRLREQLLAWRPDPTAGPRPGTAAEVACPTTDPPSPVLLASTQVIKLPSGRARRGSGGYGGGQQSLARFTGGHVPHHPVRRLLRNGARRSAITRSS
jgi:hypothetical protein